MENNIKKVTDEAIIETTNESKKKLNPFLIVTPILVVFLILMGIVLYFISKDTEINTNQERENIETTNVPSMPMSFAEDKNLKYVNDKYPEFRIIYIDDWELVAEEPTYTQSQIDELLIITLKKGDIELVYELRPMGVTGMQPRCILKEDNTYEIIDDEWVRYGELSDPNFFSYTTQQNLDSSREAKQEVISSQIAGNISVEDFAACGIASINNSMLFTSTNYTKDELEVESNSGGDLKGLINIYVQSEELISEELLMEADDIVEATQY